MIRQAPRRPWTARGRSCCGRLIYLPCHASKNPFSKGTKLRHRHFPRKVSAKPSPLANADCGDWRLLSLVLAHRPATTFYPRRLRW